MTRVLLASNDSTQAQIESLFKPNGFFEVPIMASSSQNVEMAMQTLGQMISTSVPLPMPLPLSRPEQNSAITNHHQQQLNTMTLTGLTNGNIGLQQQQSQDLTPTPQNHSLELHSNFTNNTIEDTEVRPHMCQICQATYKTRTHLRRHMFIHLTSRPYPCPDCGKGFNRKEHLNKHCELHNFQAVHSGTKYKCPYCGKEISRKDHLSRHIKNMHLSTVGNTIQLRNVGDGEPLPQGFGNAKHPKTPKQNVPRVFFPGGLTITSLNQPPVSKTQNSGSSTSRYQDSPANVVSQHNFSHNSAQQSAIGDKKLLLHLYTCPECSATFTSDRDLNIHSRIHKPQPYKCNECTRAYTRREKLTEHVRCFHQGQKFSCEYCGKELSRKDHVLRHVRSVHPEVLATRFVSIAEGGNFDSANQIRPLGSTAPLHGNNSNNIPPSMGEMGLLLRSVCKICLKVFGTSYHLSRHVESCHNGDVRPYSCNNCSKQFKRKDHLTKHRKSHCPTSRDNTGNSVFRTAIRGAGTSNPGGQPNPNEAFVTSTLNAIDAADLMHQDAINSLQIEMMTDADEDDSGDSDTSDDSNESDDNEDSKEACQNLPQNTSNDVSGGGNKKEVRKEVASTPSNQSDNDFALTMLKSSLLSENEPNENAFIHIPMDTTDGSLGIQSAFPCGHCQKEFNSKNKLLHHLQEHSNNELKGVMAQDQVDSAPKSVADQKGTPTPTVSEQMPVTSLWNS